MTEIFTLQKLFKAYNDCKKGKKNTINALHFEMNREKNLISLLGDLQNRTYEVSRHICFVVTKPTSREIFAADFRDRIVHHILYDELYNLFDTTFVETSFANRRGKGTHKAVIQLIKYIRKVKSETGGGYYLKLDVRSFFRSIDKDVLYLIIEQKVKTFGSLKWQNEILWLCRKIIFHDPTQNYVFKGNPEKRKLIPTHKSLFYANGSGLPIGNLTSQFFANVYLNQLDQFVTKNINCEMYVRYVDDFVVVGTDKEELHSHIQPINNFLKNCLHLELHRGKIQLQEVRKGIDFLGYFIKPTHTLVRQKVVRRFKNKFYFNYEKAEDVLPSINSYYGHFVHADSFKLRKHLYENHLGCLKEFMELKENGLSLRIK